MPFSPASVSSEEDPDTFATRPATATSRPFPAKERPEPSSASLAASVSRPKLPVNAARSTARERDPALAGEASTFNCSSVQARMLDA